MPTLFKLLLFLVITNAALAQQSDSVFEIAPNDSKIANDIKGSFSAKVMFFQGTEEPPSFDSYHQSYLLSLRKTCVIVRPLFLDSLSMDTKSPVILTAFNSTGKRLGTIVLSPSRQSPGDLYLSDSMTEELFESNTRVEKLSLINNSPTVAKAAGKNSDFSHEFLRVKMPISGETSETRRSTEAQIQNPDALDAAMDRSEKLCDFLTWSGKLPAEWIRPGLRLRFRKGDAIGEFEARILWSRLPKVHTKREFIR